MRPFPSCFIVTTMLSDLEGRVSSLIDVVRAMGKESEDVYLTMGRLFPEIIAETGRSAKIAEESRLSFGDESRKGNGRSIDEMNAFVADAGVWFRGLHERDEGFLRRINESMERLANLDGLIQGVRSDSEDMEIVSLNAMTVALKSGFAGKAFSVITDELKRLSSQTISLTEAITEKGRSLLEVFSTLRDAVGRLDTFQDDFFDRLESNLTGTFDLHRSELEQARGLFSTLVSDARDIKDPVQTIMQEVQHQDIVRQSLEHVVISLSEAEGAARRGKDGVASEEEEVAYVASIAKLSAQLLDDIVSRIDSSVAAFERNIDDVERRVAGIEERRVSFSTHSLAAAVESGTVANDTSRYVEFKQTVTTTARRLADQVRNLDDSFKGLATLLSRFKNIVVASRIEIAKNRSLAGVTTTVAGMVELTGKIEADVAGAMGTTKDFTKVAEAAIAEYTEKDASAVAADASAPGSFDASVDRIAAVARDARGISLVLAKVQADIETLEGRRAATRKGIVEFELFTPEFLSYIRDARKALDDLRRLSSRLGAARKELDDLEERATAALGGTIDYEIHSDRLQQMIQRFTIFTHKRAAGDLANFRVEEGVRTGEVTLF